MFAAGSEYGTSVDMWALGVLLYNLSRGCSRAPPYFVPRPHPSAAAVGL